MRIAMPYRIFWHVPEQVLCMELEGNLTLDNFNQMNQDVLDHLNGNPGEQRILLVDITRPASMPRIVAQLKSSQTYTMRNDLKFILVAGSNKFMRLMMMLTFNLCRPSLMFFDNMESAVQFAQKIQYQHTRNM